MKRILVSLLVLSAVACGNSNTNTNAQQPVDVSKTNTKDLNDIPQDSIDIDDLTKVEDAAKKLTPASIETLNNVFPETALGIKRTAITGDDGEYPSGKQQIASYNQGEKSIRISVSDGADSTSPFSLILSDVYMHTPNDVHISLGIDTVIKVGANKTSVTQVNEPYKAAALQYIVANRYAIRVEGKNVEAEELKKVLSTLDTSKLN